LGETRRLQADDPIDSEVSPGSIPYSLASARANFVAKEFERR